MFQQNRPKKWLSSLLAANTVGLRLFELWLKFSTVYIFMYLISTERFLSEKNYGKHGDL
jgi:hypothetical protein